ncbi:hypothetical protein [Pseudogemmobacter faecipullorum]|uniref:Uncharacterized protein n=1 Tax=Pseudogemmobacter faecipullorum TaxID=2755041 RepID=A0ABS8CSF4_9RHOB|nr:hypothetical protein [Pseudogemmobacter faecipullorum]MCB5411710.1 hypothetical protein [Pseudogemmobacter faecipullorum]
MNQKEDADMNAAATLHPSSDGLFGRVLGWFNDRSAKAALRKDAAKWVQSLGEAKVKALVEDVPLPEDIFSGVHTYTKEENDAAQEIYLAYADKHYANESAERRKELAAWMLYWRLRQWSSETNHERLGAVIAKDAARREAYRADYDARLNAAAAADATTPANRKAYAEQAYRNTGKYLTNTGRELTQDERYQLGLPSVREQKSGLLDAR